MSAPFNLAWGDSVYAKVFAVNVYGHSLVSEQGNGAILITYPDAPLYLAENPAFRDWTTLGLRWEEGFQNGGNDISNYVLSMATGNGLYVQIQTSIAPDREAGTTITNLVFGTTYKFKVQA